MFSRPEHSEDGESQIVENAFAIANIASNDAVCGRRASIPITPCPIRDNQIAGHSTGNVVR